MMIRNKDFQKNISLAIAGVFLFQIFFPTAALALTGGPSQPEVESFEPIGTNQMVDPFTGDFTYNIPLLDVGGYPVNISYHSGVTMDQEASWVGLGWNINPGVINRNLRGLPDDFSGDKIRREFNMKKNWTIGITGNVDLEVFGFGVKLKDQGVGGSLGLGINYNNYNGIGVDITAGISAKLGETSGDRGTANLGVSMISSSNDGATISPSLSYSKKAGEKRQALGYGTMGGNIGVSINSRAGLSSLSIGSSGSRSDSEKDASYGASTSISFMPATYLPQQKFPFESGNFSASLKIGPEIQGSSPTFGLSGYYSYQQLKDHFLETESYGYIYSEDAAQNPKALLDFNRENDRPFSKHLPNLPVTNFTYDLYGISGQGVDGMFRAHRGDVGYVRDPYVANTSSSFSLGLELGIGALAKFGFDGTVNHVSSSSGNWSNYNYAAEKLKFQNNDEGDLFEPSYFKRAGEPTINVGATGEEEWKNVLLSNGPVRVAIEGEGYNRYASENYITKSKATTGISQVKRTARDKRNQVISTLTRREVIEGMGLDSMITNYGEDHHVAEITVLKTDGGRYVYGLPAYNTFQRDATFNVSGNPHKDCSTGLIYYYGDDDSKDNKKGLDNFYESTETPPYAHSYLLTAVLSSDYSDMDWIKGPSPGDYGNYVKFGYEKISDYDWRVPFSANKASYNEGLKSLGSDDMGNYIYGKKELYYLDTIVSRTHIAFFHKSGRLDGYEANGKAGGRGYNSMLKLDSISLYTIAEYVNKSGNLKKMIPIKRVHFEYDYSLCQGVPNNLMFENMQSPDRGKLTLKKLFFTYGTSHKARFSPYKFTYADPDHDGNIDVDYNPGYNLKGYDRWGSYKPNDGGSCTPSGNLSAPEYPYTDQDEVLANKYSQAWSLTSIHVPSGGIINVDYESDDYGYVQDKHAMQMFKIAGVGNSTSFSPTSAGNVLYDGDDAYEYLFFELQEPIDASGLDPLEELKQKYFKDIIGKELYFRCLMNLAQKTFDGNYEYVSGYLKVEEIGFAPYTSGGYYPYAFIKVQKVTLDDKDDDHDVHPISKAGWQFARIHNPELAYGAGNKQLRNGPADNMGEIGEDIFYELFDAFESMAEIFSGPNSYLRGKKYSQEIVLNKSWVRLYNPDGRKYGGGSRVKKIAISDQWANMTSSGQSSEYGQEYTYRLPDGTSSGVASYEPLIGGDENPFKTPIGFSEDFYIIPDYEHYVETPFGESFFPSPSVGYSRVEVKNLQYQNVTQNATGKVVHEFYTAKDFPTIHDQTDLQPAHKPASFLSRMLKFSVRDHMNTSQGYVVETNDMHGKPKAQWVYGEGQKGYISGVEYKYKHGSQSVSQQPDVGAKRVPQRKTLVNNVPVFFHDNRIFNREVGVDYDMVNDFRQSKTEATSGGVNFNLSTILALILPVPMATLVPKFSKQTTLYRSAVTTKVVNRFAIPSETIVHDQNSSIKTENLLWDSETGEVLLTRTTNNFDDPVYSLKYPARLAYDRMGGAYKNIGYEEKVTLEEETGAFDHPSGSKFVPGDEVRFEYGEAENKRVTRGWVVQTEVAVGEDPVEYVERLCLIDADGKPMDELATTATIKVIRSGRRNMLASSMQEVVMKEDPRRTINGTLGLDIDKIIGHDPEVLSASAMEWDEGGRTARVPYDPETKRPYGIKKAIHNIPHPTIPGDGDLRDDAITAYFDLLQAMIMHGMMDFTNGRTNPLGQPVALSTLANYSPFSGDKADLLLQQFNKSEKLGSGPIYVDCEIITDYPAYWKQSGGSIPMVAPTYFQAYFLTSNQPDAQKYTFAGFFSDVFYDPVSSVAPINITDFDRSSLVTPDPAVPTRLIGVNGTSGYNGSLFSYETPDPSGGTQLLTGGALAWFAPFIGGNIVWERTCPNPETQLDQTDLKVNPYRMGIRGNWKPYRAYTYLSDREYSNEDIRKDGIYQNFDAYWSYNSSSGDWEDDNTDWTFTNTLSMFDEYGNEVENEDALGRYSAALYDFEGALPTAVGQNIQRGQFAYDGFENGAYVNEDCKRGYFEPYPRVGEVGANYSLEFTDAHTGSTSARVENEGLMKYEIYFLDADKDCKVNTPSVDIPYYCIPCDVMGSFGQYELRQVNQNPIADTLIVSYWIKRTTNSLTTSDYQNPIKVCLGDVSIEPDLDVIHVSPVIDGWQKIEKRLIPGVPGANGYKIDLNFLNTNEEDYLIDDIRVFPDYGQMKSFAYDPVTLRLAAELDENNYATFYEYDEEGMLVRIKKETERGIVTIKEHHNHNPKP